MRREAEREYGEMVEAGGGRQYHGFGWTSMEKSWKGKDKDQIKEFKARTTSMPKPLMAV